MGESRKNDFPKFFHLIHVFRVEHRAAARCDHASGRRCKRRNYLGFDFSETGFSMGFKNLGNLFVFPFFDQFVRINERKVQNLGKPKPGSGFAGTHKPGQKDIVLAAFFEFPYGGRNPAL